MAPTTPDDLARAHPTWEADISAFGPWTDAVEVAGLGRFVAAQGSAEERSRKTEPGQVIVVVGECDSTMEAARLLAGAGVLGPWDAVTAVRQRGGRGQMRRPWVSSAGNVHVSVIMPASPSDGPWREAATDLLPLVAGHVCAEVLEPLGCRIEIKWPNDLLRNGRKVGGMLIEERNGLVVLGVGLNLVESPADGLMREDHSVPAGTLGIAHPPGGALVLCEALVNRGRNVYATLFDELEPSRFLSAVTNRLAWHGRRVRVTEGGQESYQAEIAGLSSKGGLVLRRAGREVVLYSGSIFPL
ncbi:biotin--[acetyl-CoA-carboxylase] ligase [Pseudodesulfovibrio pelocollis]|uniref:biotin--[acetyl-CoA-carboxylase] ligase n=1 Tax=Pseudodesulfovibrio pelocollis TaxID=3051432 RepID=UPI00255A825C|nr:biotin--[acetyl-CoA-carboxylase] ligase [Pseudodesulfovibrio sp. SB368]